MHTLILILLNNEMYMFYNSALSHMRVIIMYYHFAISSETSAIPPFIGRHSRNYRANLHLHVGTVCGSVRKLHRHERSPR